MLWRNGYVLHAYLIAIVEGRSSSQGQQQEHCNPRLSVSKTTGDTRFIMVTQHIVGPCSCRHDSLQLIDRLPDSQSVPGGSEQAKIERKVEFIEVSTIESCPGTHVGAIEFSNAHTRLLLAIALQKLA